MKRGLCVGVLAKLANDELTSLIRSLPRTTRFTVFISFCSTVWSLLLFIVWMYSVHHVHCDYHTCIAIMHLLLISRLNVRVCKISSLGWCFLSWCRLYLGRCNSQKHTGAIGCSRTFVTKWEWNNDSCSKCPHFPGRDRQPRFVKPKK